MMKQEQVGQQPVRQGSIPDLFWGVSFFFLMLSVICFGGGDRGSNYYYYFTFFLFVGYTLILSLVRGGRRLRVPLPMQTFWYGMFIVLSLLSCLWADSVPSVLYPISRMVQILAITYCMTLYIDSTERLERYITALMAATLFMIFYIYIRTPRTRWFAGFLGQVTHYNTNDVGCALSVCVLFAFYEAYVRKKKICYALAAIAMLTAALTSSRKALLMCVFGVLMIVAFHYRERNYILRVLIFLTGLTTVIILIYRVPLLYGAVGWRLNKMVNYIMNEDASDYSLYTRQFFIDMAKRFFEEKPLLGIGLHNFSFRIRDYSNVSAYAHNNYMEIAADLGIVGLIMYYWFYAYLVLKLAKQMLNGHKNALLFLPMMLLFVVFEYGMVNYYKTQVQMGLAAAFAAVVINDAEDRRNAAKKAA